MFGCKSSLQMRTCADKAQLPAAILQGKRAPLVAKVQQAGAGLFLASLLTVLESLQLFKPL